MGAGLCCAPPTCVVHHGAQGEPMSMTLLLNIHANQGSQRSSVLTYTSVVHNVALYTVM